MTVYRIAPEPGVVAPIPIAVEYASVERLAWVHASRIVTGSGADLLITIIVGSATAIHRTTTLPAHRIALAPGAGLPMPITVEHASGERPAYTHARWTVWATGAAVHMRIIVESVITTGVMTIRLASRIA